MLDIEIEKLNVDRTIQGRVKRQMERRRKSITSTRRSRPSRRNWAAAKKSEIDELKKRIETAGMTADARKRPWPN
jgi:ATP-dependent Lon protease